jgi:hypothetical protein
MNSTFIQKRLFTLFDYSHRICNAYIFEWESDYLFISKSGYTSEVEIKISRSDFLADFKKNKYTGGKKHDYLTSDKTCKANKFWFACPDNLIKIEDIDNRYGLVYVSESGNIRIIQQAKFLHKELLLKDLRFVKILMNAFYWRYIKVRELADVKEYELKFEK